MANNEVDGSATVKEVESMKQMMNFAQKSLTKPSLNPAAAVVQHLLYHKEKLAGFDYFSMYPSDYD